MREYDIVIVGAGPAGLFAAIELVLKAKRKLRIAVMDRGLRASQRRCPMLLSTRRILKQECMKCNPCNILYGVGGAGTLSSGIINLRPDIGGDLDKLLGSWDEAEELIYYIDELFVKFGAPKDRLFKPDPIAVGELERAAAKIGAKFIPIIQRHIGTDNAIRVIENITRFLELNKVNVMPQTMVKRIIARQRLFTLQTTRGEYTCKYLILAPGRGGAAWLSQEARDLGLEVEPGPLDMGIRVEVPAYVMEPITNIIMDPKIILYTKAYDDKVRTFCTNPHGFVIEEFYEDGTIGVNGETYTSIKSKNTNFALLVTVKLTDPLEDTIAYGKSIAMLATKLGGGKPLIQRFGDLESGRRSTWPRIERSTVEPTLRNVTPGDIGMALPYRIVEDLIEAIHRLDNMIPGLASPQTLLYAPEIKYYSVKVKVNRDMETNIENLFVAGDGAGLSRGINVAAATGVLAARGILKKMGLYEEEELTFTKLP